jgi:hypothetical protein
MKVCLCTGARLNDFYLVYPSFYPFLNREIKFDCVLQIPLQ